MGHLAALPTTPGTSVIPIPDSIPASAVIWHVQAVNNGRWVTLTEGVQGALPGEGYGFAHMDYWHNYVDENSQNAVYDVVTQANFVKQEGNGKTAYYEWLGSNNPLTAGYQVELIVVVGGNGDVITSYPVAGDYVDNTIQGAEKSQSHGGLTPEPITLNPTS